MEGSSIVTNPREYLAPDGWVFCSGAFCRTWLEEGHPTGRCWECTEKEKAEAESKDEEVTDP